jgi:hypothetical protein
MQVLRDKGVQFQLIADSNSFFVETILKDAELNDVFTGIITNPAKIDKSGIEGVCKDDMISIKSFFMF